MSSQQSFNQVLEHLRKLDNDTARAVYERYASRLIALARGKLSAPILQRMDPEDVVQSVFHSVYLRLADGEFEIGDWDSLWGLLTRVTIHKCHKWVDYYQAQSRDLGREAALPADAEAGWQFLDRGPTPSEATVLAEAIDRALLGLDERERQIVMLSLQGHSPAEVGTEVGCTQSKVYRVLRFIRQRLERMSSED